MMNGKFEPRNELEQRLMEAQEGRIPGDEFMRELLVSQVFMPVFDTPTIGGIQVSTKARPLALDAEDGTRILVLFTSPERSKPFLDDFPGYTGGILEQFKWVLERMGRGYGIVLNPGWDVGIDLEPEMVEQLAAAHDAGRQ